MNKLRYIETMLLLLQVTNVSKSIFLSFIDKSRYYLTSDSGIKVSKDMYNQKKTILIIKRLKIG